MFIRVVNEYHMQICTLLIREISNVNPGEELFVIINSKSIPFKVIYDGGFMNLMVYRHSIKNAYPNKELHGLISTISNFNALRTLIC